MVPAEQPGSSGSIRTAGPPAPTECFKKHLLQTFKNWNIFTDSMDEFEQIPGDGEGQGGQVRCSPWGLKESETAE